MSLVFQGLPHGLSERTKAAGNHCGGFSCIHRVLFYQKQEEGSSLAFSSQELACLVLKELPFFNFLF
jgi:hypothetical protein